MKEFFINFLFGFLILSIFIFIVCLLVWYNLFVFFGILTMVVITSWLIGAVIRNIKEIIKHGYR